MNKTFLSLALLFSIGQSQAVNLDPVQVGGAGAVVLAGLGAHTALNKPTTGLGKGLEKLGKQVGATQVVTGQYALTIGTCGVLAAFVPSSRENVAVFATGLGLAAVTERIGYGRITTTFPLATGLTLLIGHLAGLRSQFPLSKIPVVGK